MQRKPKDSPLNLIQILPPKDGASPSTRYNPASGHFKIQIGAEESSRWMRWLAHVVAGIAAVLRSIGSITLKSFHHGKRAMTFAGMALNVITRGFVMLMKRGFQGTVFTSTQLATLFQRVGEQIRVCGQECTVTNETKVSTGHH